LRDNFISRYSTITQNFRIPKIEKLEGQRDMLDAMRGAVAGIASLSGHIRALATWSCMQVAMSKVQRAGTLESLRLHIKVFSAHCCWRYIPLVVRALPDLLLPKKQVKQVGSKPTNPAFAFFQQFLEQPRFQEPEKPGVPLTVVQRGHVREKLCFHREGGATTTWKRWMAVATALSELARWLRLEIINFRRKVQLWDVTGAAKKSTSSTEPLGDDCQTDIEDEDMAAEIEQAVEAEIWDLEDASSRTCQAALPSQDVLDIVDGNQDSRLHQSDSEDSDDGSRLHQSDSDLLTHQPESEREHDKTDSRTALGIGEWKLLATR